MTLMRTEVLNDASKVIARCVDQLRLMRERTVDRFEEECLRDLMVELDWVLDKLCRERK